MRLFNSTVRFPLTTLLPVLLTLGCSAANRQSAGGAVGKAANGGSATAHATSRGANAADVVDPMQGAPKDPLPWADFSPATFARAKAEGRFIVMDGSAEWCHWCHVMEATTYHDPAIRKLLAEHFVQVKVDVDSRPDLEERYGDYGWPATVIFSPDAGELGKYRGYISPDKFAEILRSVIETKAGAKSTGPGGATSNDVTPAKGSLPKPPLSEEEIAWIRQFTILELDEYYDEAQGGWGRSQKAPLAWDDAWALARAKAGDSSMRGKVLFTLDQQRKLIDPVWGGIYQYSASTDWDHPHFEKLMPYEAGALDNYAEAYALTHESKYAEAAKAIRGYIDSFLRAPDGAFYATQDADLNAHDASKRFMSGHDYYAKGDAERRALGVPRVDTHVYARDNGLAIAAYVTLFEATRDATALAVAQKAADRVLATHASTRGGVAHDAVLDAAVLYLSDNAAMGFALMRLYEATHEPKALEGATRIADFMLKELYDGANGGFFAQTIDPDAVGVFAARRTPFEDNVMAIRFLTRRARIGTAAGNAAYAKAIAGAIRAIATPEEIKNRGRMLGDFLLALEESKGIRETPK